MYRERADEAARQFGLIGVTAVAVFVLTILAMGVLPLNMLKVPLGVRGVPLASQFREG
jgi:hypothetical protein